MARKRFWLVKVVTNNVAVAAVYGKDYFPRRFYYFKDACKLQKKLWEQFQANSEIREEDANATV